MLFYIRVLTLIGNLIMVKNLGHLYKTSVGKQKKMIRGIRPPIKLQKFCSHGANLTRRSDNVLVYNQFVSRCVWCYDIPALTTDYVILPRLYKGIEERNLFYWKFVLFGDCSYTFVFNDSSVVRLKEYKEIHKEARLL